MPLQSLATNTGRPECAQIRNGRRRWAWAGSRSGSDRLREAKPSPRLTGGNERGARRETRAFHFICTPTQPRADPLDRSRPPADRRAPHNRSRDGRFGPQSRPNRGFRTPESTDVFPSLFSVWRLPSSLTYPCPWNVQTRLHTHRQSASQGHRAPPAADRAGEAAGAAAAGDRGQTGAPPTPVRP